MLHHDAPQRDAPSSIGVALSGGGYRATLFAAGALVALHDMNLWPQIGWIASVSGGSFANAAAALWLGDEPTRDDMSGFVRRVRSSTSRPLSLLGIPRSGSGMVGSVYEAGIRRTWLNGEATTLEHLQRPNRIHAFLAVDLATMEPTYLTPWFIHSLGFRNEGHIAVKPGALGLAKVLRASAAFPGLPAVRVRPQDVEVDVAEFELRNDLFLSDAGVWNNLGTNWAPVASTLNPEIVPLPEGVPRSVDMRVVVDASGPPRKAGRRQTGHGPFALDRPVVNFFRAFGAAVHGSTAANRLLLRDVEYRIQKGIVAVSLEDSSLADGRRQGSGVDVRTFWPTLMGINRRAAIDLLAYGHALTVRGLGDGDTGGLAFRKAQARMIEAGI